MKELQLQGFSEISEEDMIQTEGGVVWEVCLGIVAGIAIEKIVKWAWEKYV